MKKIIFIAALLVTIVLLVQILQIVIQDLDRLTAYGYGYLTGKISLLLGSFSIAFITRKGFRAS